jgi:hypothetical protein
MTTKKSLCSSHITALEKVRNQLSYKQTMNYTQLILSKTNSAKMDKAKKLVSDAIKILSEVK